MSIRSLPDEPNLRHLKLQAKTLLRQLRSRHEAALIRLATHHPGFRNLTSCPERTFRLADAQLVLAREYGFTNWAALKQHVDRLALDQLPVEEQFFNIHFYVPLALPKIN